MVLFKRGVLLMKNKMICTLLTTVMVLSFAACGSQGNGAASAESTVTSEIGAEASTAESSAAEASAETTTEASADATNGTSYEDNFAVSTEDAAAFAKKIQDAVAAEDLNALADLVNYPVYVALGDGSVIETREDLIALGADKIFTPELKDSMANADLSELSPSMAGFTLYSTGDGPNITFNVQNGVLGISITNFRFEPLRGAFHQAPLTRVEITVVNGTIVISMFPSVFLVISVAPRWIYCFAMPEYPR